MRCFLGILTAILCLPSLQGSICAADDDFPSSLLGFIKPGMHISLRSSKADSLVAIEIFSEAQFRFAKDARDMKFEELGQKYPKVSDKAAKALADYRSSIEARRSENTRRPSLPSSVEPFVALAVDRAALLCTVLHVGEDYFFVTYSEDNSKKQVIAKQAVSRIRWASDDLRFRTSLRPAQPQD
jgi:hypothetical protein